MQKSCDKVALRLEYALANMKVYLECLNQVQAMTVRCTLRGRTYIPNKNQQYHIIL